MHSRLHQIRWPMSAWYAAAFIVPAVLGALLGWLSWAIHGVGFWAAFIGAVALGGPWQAYQLWRYQRRRTRARESLLGREGTR